MEITLFVLGALSIGLGAFLVYLLWYRKEKQRLDSPLRYSYRSPLNYPTTLTLTDTGETETNRLRLGTLRSVPRPPQGEREKARRLRQLQLLTQPPSVRSTDARSKAASVSSPLSSPLKSPLVLPGVVTEMQETSPDATRALEAPESLAGVSSSSPSPTTENAATGLETQNTGGIDFSSCPASSYNELYTNPPSFGYSYSSEASSGYGSSSSDFGSSSSSSSSDFSSSY